MITHKLLLQLLQEVCTIVRFVVCDHAHLLCVQFESELVHMLYAHDSTCMHGPSTMGIPGTVASCVNGFGTWVVDLQVQDTSRANAAQNQRSLPAAKKM